MQQVTQQNVRRIWSARTQIMQDKSQNVCHPYWMRTQHLVPLHEQAEPLVPVPQRVLLHEAAEVRVALRIVGCQVAPPAALQLGKHDPAGSPVAELYVMY